MFFSKKIPDDSVVLISVVRARLSPNGLGSGDPNLQGGALLLISREDALSTLTGIGGIS